MQVTVNHYLNVRVGKPSLNAPRREYLAPGTLVTVDGNYYTGDLYESNNQWMRDALNNYYWSGALTLLENTTTAPAPVIQEHWWLKSFQVPQLWAMGLTGKGIKIAILDTGISYPHQDLDLNPNQFIDVTASPSGTEDRYGHGTHCCGIIKSGNNALGSTGVAYDANLFICKVTHDENGDRAEYLAKGVNWAIAQEVDIISISKGDPYGAPELEAAMNDATAKGILVVCAAGNKVIGLPEDHIYFPARYTSALSVGGITENNLPLKDSILTGETQLFAPGDQLVSCYKNNAFAALSGSSQAAPYVAGVAALLLEQQRKANAGIKAIALKSILTNNGTAADFGTIINPLKTINA